ncbi:hypothetical protein G5B88_11925 [Herbaspirillum seropedicae]|uniref:hypothetical protein n=1 Tax=Herbaspirillum seropedicae TaxID=964 RepID=UPI0012E1B285|nr:hypothetical protein [Herbaspirillum seropedicae]UMU21828.1 hypothetical protein G5B88_11925 [Herbaspirillum seropedicae]
MVALTFTLSGQQHAQCIAALKDKAGWCHFQAEDCRAAGLHDTARRWSDIEKDCLAIADFLSQPVTA